MFLLVKQDNGTRSGDKIANSPIRDRYCVYIAISIEKVVVTRFKFCSMNNIKLIKILNYKLNCVS